jgi:hypothetical protein
VRLDHLLSKEPSPHHEVYSRVDHSLLGPPRQMATSQLRLCRRSVERPYVLSSVLRECLPRAPQGNAGHWVLYPAGRHPCVSNLVGQTLLENCIASTSIFVLPSYKKPTVDALAPSTDEGRGWPRKATGSCRPSVDPWMSEWGNPAPVMGCHSRLNL